MKDDPTRFMRGDHLDPSNAMRAAERHLEAVTMSETKFTPGPWRVRAHTSQPNDRVVVDTFGGSVACVYRDMGENEPPREANAHLIAAAPDLYAALEALHRATAILPASMDEPGSPQALARAALAKARGETP